MKIALAGDHAGYNLKKKIIEYLSGKDHEIKDFGAYSDENSDYPDFAHILAESVGKGESELGISMCGSGNGINMAANKHATIRSALCWRTEIAVLAKQHNNANVCAIPARFVTEHEAIEIVEAFLSTEFEGGRHKRRIEKIPIK